MSSFERMFIAIWADEIGDNIERLQDRLRAADGDFRWTAPENLHLTIKFLGETTLLHSAKVCRAVQRITTEYQATELEVAGARLSKIERPRTLWAGVREARRLRTLQPTLMMRWPICISCPTAASSPI